jgi:hypothetical protein
MPPNLDPRERLIDTPGQALGQRVPECLHERLDQLCDIAYAAGEPQRPTKMQMVGALIFGGPSDPDELVELLRRYGRATVGDAMVGTTIPAGAVIELPARKSGPRSSRRSTAVVRSARPSSEDRA